MFIFYYLTASTETSERIPIICGLSTPCASSAAADLRKWQIGLESQFSYDDSLKTFSTILIMIIHNLKRLNLRRGDKS